MDFLFTYLLLLAALQGVATCPLGQVEAPDGSCVTCGGDFCKENPTTCEGCPGHPTSSTNNPTTDDASTTGDPPTPKNNPTTDDSSTTGSGSRIKGNWILVMVTAVLVLRGM